MAPYSQNASSPKNPNSIPLGPRQQREESVSIRPAILPNNHRYAARPRSRSPLRPVQPIEIHEDEEWSDENWTADKEELYNQIEKLTLKLDTANSLVSSQKAHIEDLKEELKTKSKLVDEYQKRVRKDIAAVEGAIEAREKVTEQCERFRDEIVKLSHEVHYLNDANTGKAGRYRSRYVKMRRERDLARDELAQEQAKKNRFAVRRKTAERRAMDGDYDV